MALKPTLVFFTLLLTFADSAAGQEKLRQQIAEIAKQARGTVSVACSLPGTPLNCDLNPHGHPPMQSVFKAPLAVTMLHRVEQGKWTLDQPIRFLASDRILPHVYSPLQEKYPSGNVDVPLRELIRLTVSESDNVAADILLRLLGGPAAVQDYMKSLGVTGLRLVDGERAMHRDTKLQYRNWFEPAGAVGFLRLISDRSPLNASDSELLLGWMTKSQRGASRMQSGLPEGTVVIHKAGSSSTKGDLTNAWNDIGLIALPGGRRVALAVFLTDSHADERTRTGVIAQIARAVYDAAVTAH